jgi:hypothetical protein
MMRTDSKSRCVLRHAAHAALLLAASLPVQAGSRLGFTGGVTGIDGAGGAGLATWALVGGLGTRDEVSPVLSATRVDTDDFSLDVVSATIGAWNRVELSYARQRFDAGAVIPGVTLGQDIWGVKVRLAGDAVFDGDRIWPQLSVGAQHKRTRDFDIVPRAVGAVDGTDTEFYLAATKVYFAALAGRNVAVNATLRRTRANQYGLLGFGGPGRDTPAWRPELTVAAWPSDDLLVGVEYRAKAAGVTAFGEDAARDVFVAWAPHRRVTLVGGWVDLGRIATLPRQRGSYLSLWLSY